LHREIGFTLLYVTLTRTEATDLSNRTIHLQHGRIVARLPGRGDKFKKGKPGARLMETRDSGDALNGNYDEPSIPERDAASVAAPGSMCCNEIPVEF